MSSDFQGLTEREMLVFRYIKTRIDAGGVSPTYREISEYCDLQSLGSVAEVIEQLVRKGRLIKGKGSARSIQLAPKIRAFFVPQIGAGVSAPSPSGAQEMLEKAGLWHDACVLCEIPLGVPQVVLSSR